MIQAVLLVGAGRMGSALLRGWIASKTVARIHIIEPQPSPEVKQLAKTGAIILQDAPDIASLPPLDAAVLAMKPQTIRSEADFQHRLGSVTPLLLSIAAGITTAALTLQLGTGTRVIRAMPNTPGAIGHGITALFAAANATSGDRDVATALMSALGQTVWIAEESLMDAVTALSGSGPAYVFLLGEALAAAGREQGLDPETADLLARHTVSGGGALIAADPRPLSALRQDVTSPGGTTAAALNVLMAQGELSELIARAVAAATARGKALGKSG